MSNNLSDLLHSISALHYLPATAQSASAPLLSCIRTLSGVLDYISALVTAPRCLANAPDGIALQLLASLNGMTGLVHGFAVPKGRALLNALEEQVPQVVSEAHQLEHDRQIGRMLQLVKSWQVMLTCLWLVVTTDCNGTLM